MKTLFLSLLLLMAAGTSACTQGNNSPVNNTPMAQEDIPDGIRQGIDIADGWSVPIILAPENTSHVLERAEQMPQFPGGEEALFEFIKENLVYPKKALK
ncbi:hypothetical protein LJB84_03455, partial [Bacteroidales bacterium OttesenSCG-928-J19]|nr:hypothetical protein [Bacteroidales bacterium OttesenSCG-928-J19]